MAHPRGTASLRARTGAATQNGEGNGHTTRPDSFKDDTPLLDESAILLKHEMMEESAIEIELARTEKAKDDSERLCFRQDGPDGKRFIDLVLVYETPCGDQTKVKEEEKEKERALAEKRKAFEANLREAGVELEYEDAVEISENEKCKTHFVKLHGPWEMLANCAEDMMMKMPIKEYDIDIKSWSEKYMNVDVRQTVFKYNPFVIHDSTIPKPKSYFVAYFRKDRLNEFIGDHDKANFFPKPERSRMIEHICEKTRFGEGRFDVGIRKMIFHGAYLAYYPLHSGSEKLEPGCVPTNDRQQLKQEWAQFSRWYKYQPYHAIKEYFGTEVGLYFAWLGFYTAMLVPAAIVGLIVFIYGISVAGSYPPVLDACNSTNERLFYMCPLCDKQCSYWSLLNFCYYVRVVYMFDNDSTVVLAFFMSIWATVFLEFWKRRQAILSYEWHMMHFEESEEQPRPEFLVGATTLRKNPVTGKQEPHIPKRQRYQRLAGAASVIAFMILLVLAAVVGVVVYRVAVYAYLMGFGNLEVQKQAKMTTSITAGLINLICISLLKFVYQILAVKLTDWENPRTRTDYEDSFTYKMFLFQFVNTYSSILYIAFFKLNFVVGTPGNYGRLAGGRLVGCSAGGCLFDLCIQLVIVMLGLQLIGNITEVAIPGLKKWWKMRQAQKNDQALPQWELDYKLEALPDHHMFWEYLEVVLQFGFVTMFVAAFPLAPLFALLNCTMEVRVDALNFVDQFRRPTPTRAQDIGAWFRIMEGLVNLSVLVNAFVLAFTSDYIPRLVYKIAYSADGSLNGFLDNSMSSYNVSYFASGKRPENPTKNLNYTQDFCRYPGYNEQEPPFDVSKQYWHVVAARLAFVFVFQYVVYAITKFVAYLVPDRPRMLDLKIKREEYLAKQALEERAIEEVLHDGGEPSTVLL